MSNWCSMHFPLRCTNVKWVLLLQCGPHKSVDSGYGMSIIQGLCFRVFNWGSVLQA